MWRGGEQDDQKWRCGWKEEERIILKAKPGENFHFASRHVWKSKVAI
jgi:hypothetical protein